MITCCRKGRMRRKYDQENDFNGISSRLGMLSNVAVRKEKRAHIASLYLFHIQEVHIIYFLMFDVENEGQVFVAFIVSHT